MNLKGLLFKLVTRSFVPHENQMPSFSNRAKETPYINLEDDSQRSFYPVAWLNQFTASAMLREFDSSISERSYPSLRDI